MSEQSNESTRRTPLYDEHKALGGRLVPFAGWELPIQYAGISEEHRAVRTAAGLFDVCHMGELELLGEQSLSVINYLVTNDVSKLVDGQALYTTCCNEQGTVLDDLIIYRAASDSWIVVCNASNREKISAHFSKAAAGRCEFRDISDETALIALQGPKALEILAACGKEAAECASLKPFHFCDAIVANVQATVARTGYTGEDGVEIFCPADQVVQLWRTLLTVGRELGLQPAGLGARDTLRLEARLSLYGNDIDETTNPLEAGLGWVVKFDKGDFVGRAALEAIKREGVTRKIVGFEMTGRGIARHGYPIKDSAGQVVGVCTSGGPAPTLGKNIGLGYVPSALAEIGSKLIVDCRGKDVEAVVVKTPFYKRPSARLAAPTTLASFFEETSKMAGSDVRDEYGYTKDHEWVSTGAERLVGITAYAVEQLGDVTLVTIDVKPGDTITAGKPFGTVESVKTLSDLFAPLSGKVIRVNGELDSKPELVNEDPYGKAWFIAIESDDAGAELLDAAAYRKFLETAGLAPSLPRVRERLV